jgi:hypothetical protein
MVAVSTDKHLLIVAALVECFAGAALILVPTLSITLLLEVEPGSVAPMVARVAGVALLALGIACAGAAMETARPARGPVVAAITFYNAGVGVLLLAFDVRGTAHGPVVLIVWVFHLALAMAFAVWGLAGADETVRRRAA